MTRPININLPAVWLVRVMLCGTSVWLIKENQKLTARVSELEMVTYRYGEMTACAWAVVQDIPRVLQNKETIHYPHFTNGMWVVVEKQ